MIEVVDQKAEHEEKGAYRHEAYCCIDFAHLKVFKDIKLDDIYHWTAEQKDESDNEQICGIYPCIKFFSAFGSWYNRNYNGADDRETFHNGKYVEAQDKSAYVDNV